MVQRRNSQELLDDEEVGHWTEYSDEVHLLNDLKYPQRQQRPGSLECQCGPSDLSGVCSRSLHSSERDRCSLSSGRAESRFYLRSIPYLRPPKRISRLQIIVIIVGLLYAGVAINTLSNPSPPYDIVATSRYQSVLEKSSRHLLDSAHATSVISQLQNALRPSNASQIQASTTKSETAAWPLPTTLWQTEKTRNPEVDEAEEIWKKAGAVQHFLDDQAGAEWVQKTFNGSEIRTVYDQMPAGVLKPDMLRYLLLLIEGGIYSDVDTRPLKPIPEWTSGTVQWKGSRSLSKTAFRQRSWPPSTVGSQQHARGDSSDDLQREAPPVRIVVGIENDATLWHRSIRNIAETLLILPLNRHRPLQFVQWTLLSQPSHPIMLDVVRRIVNRANLARALLLDRDSRADAAELAGNLAEAERIRKEKMPWYGRNMRKSGIEEWTGPGAWTDAVFSYLSATANISPKHLEGLVEPLQIGDVVILPADGFNPICQMPWLACSTFDEGPGKNLEGASAWKLYYKSAPSLTDPFSCKALRHQPMPLNCHIHWGAYCMQLLRPTSASTVTVLNEVLVATDNLPNLVKDAAAKEPDRLILPCPNERDALSQDKILELLEQLIELEMATSRNRSLCIVRSSINVDDTLNVHHIVKPGETISSSSLTSRAGGKGANVAVAISLADVDVYMIAHVGDGPSFPVDEMSKRGVDVGGVKKLPDVSIGRTFIQIAEDGENSIVLIKGANYAPNASTDTPSSAFSLPSRRPTHLVVQNEIPLAVTRSFLAHAHQSSSRITTVFNPSPMLSKAEIQEFNWADVDILVVNEGEGQELLQAFGESDAQDAQAILQALDSLDQLRSLEWLVLTRGAHGVLASVRDDQSSSSRTHYDVPSCKPRQVVDTTGAGDTFAGNLVAGLMRAADAQSQSPKESASALPSAERVREILQTAVQAAAMAVEKEGAMESIPRLADVHERLREK